MVYQGTSFVCNSEAVQIGRKDGSRAVGIITYQSADPLIIFSVAGSPPASIPLPVTFMSQGRSQILSPAELAAIFSYLQSGR